MKYGKTDGRKDAVGFLFGIAAVIIILGAILSCAMYVVIQKSFFQATVTHEMELMLSDKGWLVPGTAVSGKPHLTAGFV